MSIRDLYFALSEEAAVKAPFLGREAECEQLRQAWSSVLEPGADPLPKPLFIYLSGRPGAGKTAAVTRVQEEMRVLVRQGRLRKHRVHWINCAHIRTAAQIYAEVWRSFCRSGAPVGGKRKRVGAADNADEDAEERRAVENPRLIGQALQADRTGQPLVLVLDEVHELTARLPDVLSHVVRWQSADGSSLSVIGISNALNTVDCVATGTGAQAVAAAKAAAAVAVGATTARGASETTERSRAPLSQSSSESSPDSRNGDAIPSSFLPDDDTTVATRSGTTVRVHFEVYSSDSIHAAVTARLSGSESPSSVIGTPPSSEKESNAGPVASSSSSSSLSAAAVAPPSLSAPAPQDVTLPRTRIPLLDWFDGGALKFCALKAAKSGGDMRRAFEILSRAVGLFEEDARNGTKPVTRVGVTHVAAATKETLSPDSSVRINEMPVPHKHLLCAVVLAFEAEASAPPPRRLPPGKRAGRGGGRRALGAASNKRKKPTETLGIPFLKIYGKFLELNSRLGVPATQRCSRDNLFVMATSLAEARGLIELKRADTAANSLILLSSPLSTIKQALSQDAMYANILKQ